jgi:hypothetical protein
MVVQKRVFGGQLYRSRWNPIQADDKVPKPLNRSPLSSKAHCPVRHSNLGSVRLQDSQVSHASFPPSFEQPDATRSLTLHPLLVSPPAERRKSRHPTNGRLYDGSWIVRHEKGMTQVGATAHGRLAFGTTSRVAGEQGNRVASRPMQPQPSRSAPVLITIPLTFLPFCPHARLAIHT